MYFYRKRQRWRQLKAIISMPLTAELDPIEKGNTMERIFDPTLPLLNEAEIQALAWHLRELMPIGMNYNKRRFSEFINFLCHHFNIERAQLVDLMARPKR